MNQTTLHLEDDYVKLEQTVQGMKQEKLLSYRDMIDGFKSIAPEGTDTGLLPSKWGVQRIATKGTKSLYMVLEAPHTRTIRYSSRDPFAGLSTEVNQSLWNEADKWYHLDVDMGVPAALYYYATRKRERDIELTTSSVFALDRPILTGREPLRRMPYSNIYDSGTICWGHAGFLFPTAKSLQGIPNRFFSAPFNRDLDGPIIDKGDNHFSSLKDAMVQEYLHEHTPEEKIEFMTRHLTPPIQNKTVNSMFDNLYNQYLR